MTSFPFGPQAASVLHLRVSGDPASLLLLLVKEPPMPWGPLVPPDTQARAGEKEDNEGGHHCLPVREFVRAARLVSQDPLPTWSHKQAVPLAPGQTVPCSTEAALASEVDTSPLDSRGLGQGWPFPGCKQGCVRLGEEPGGKWGVDRRTRASQGPDRGPWAPEHRSQPP